MRRIVRSARRLTRILALAARLSQLGPGFGSKAKIVYVTILLGARRIVRRPGERWHTLRLRVADTEPEIAVSDYGELEVMRDILLDEDYALGELSSPRLILDVGANIGLAALYFRARYPDAEIVAVEPDPDTFAKLERNVGADPRARVVNVAASDEAGEIVLYRPPGYSIASSLKRSEPGNGYARVRAEPLDRLCEELGVSHIDLLKLDVEGAELEVLRGFSRLAEVPVVIGEAHPLLLGDRTEELFELLGGFDVRRLSETEDAISFLATRR